MIGVIYKIINPTGKVYIGQTIDYRKRIRSYKNSICKGQPKLFNSFQKYGFENHIFEIIDKNILAEHLSFIETINIWLYDSYSNGLNCTPFGGYVFRGKRHSIESRKKMSKSRTGKRWKFSEEAKNSMSLIRIEAIKSGKIKPSRIGAKLSEESKRKISKAHIGKKHTKEHIEKIRLSKIGTKHSEESKRKRVTSNKNTILNEEIVKSMKKDFKSGLKLREISEKYNINQSTITNVVYNRSWKHVII